MTAVLLGIRDYAVHTLLEPTGPNRTDRLKHESPLARGGFRIAGAGFEPATFGL